MKLWLPGIWLIGLLTILFVGISMSNIDMLVTHTYVQATLDSSTDAGVNQTMTKVTRTTSRNGLIRQSKRIVDPAMAQTAAERTFDKNVQNLSDMGIRQTDKIQAPTFSFPDEESMAGTVVVTHDMGLAVEPIQNLFDDPSIRIQEFDVTLNSVSKVNSKK